MDMTFYTMARDFLKWVHSNFQREFAGSGELKIGASGKQKSYIWISIRNKGKIPFKVIDLYIHHAEKSERLPVDGTSGLCDKLGESIKPNKCANYCSRPVKFITRLKKLNDNTYPDKAIFKKYTFEAHSNEGEIKIIPLNDFLSDLNSFITDNNPN